MQHLSRAARVLALVAALVAASTAALAVPSAEAAAGPPTTAPAQLYGYPWGGIPIGPGGAYLAPAFSSPYSGSPGYPYYRYGGYYGSAYGFPYPIYPDYGAYYGGAYGTQYPSYSSAGGVALGGVDGAGYFAPLGLCMYSASAGYGGSWSDPTSYGYYAPFC